MTDDTLTERERHVLGALLFNDHLWVAGADQSTIHALSAAGLVRTSPDDSFGGRQVQITDAGRSAAADLGVTAERWTPAR